MFIPPMLCTRLTDPRRLDDRRYVAEPKFDGQRAQIHVAGGRTVAAYSRRRLDLLRHAGLAWLREVRWPVTQVVLDGEVRGETGSDGIQAVLEARGHAHREALRALGAKWLKIIFVLWERQVPYDETYHLATMARQQLRQRQKKLA